MRKLQQLLNKSKQEQWPYPKTFQTLKNVGVEYYTVCLLNGYDAIYEGSFGAWREATTSDGPYFVIENDFYVEELRDAIKKHAQKKTSFLEFLDDIAAAGVAYYEVDMRTSTITYFNSNSSQSYQEIVPSWDVIE